MKERKKIKCDISKSIFGEKGTLEKHVAEVHEGKKLFKCEICNAQVTSRNGKKRHTLAYLIIVQDGINV